MDRNPRSISPTDLYADLGSASAPLVIDVRSPEAFAAADRLVVGAVRRVPDDISLWQPELPRRAVAVYCTDGQEISQGVATALAATDVKVAYLEGGFAGWTDAGLPTRRKLSVATGKWVTRERPKIDRIACPWLIRQFIEPDAEFIYVSEERVLDTARETGAIPYDVKGVEFTHEGDRCSFDTILRIFDIKEPALDHLAAIVRGADTSRHDLTPQCGGVFAISLGLSANFQDDHEMLRHGMVMYDALYTWCRSLQTETHNWPAKANE